MKSLFGVGRFLHFISMSQSAKRYFKEGISSMLYSDTTTSGERKLTNSDLHARDRYDVALEIRKRTAIIRYLIIVPGNIHKQQHWKEMKNIWTIFVCLNLFLLLFLSCREPDHWVYMGSYGFSPNGDGVNELFIIPFDTTKVNQMTIIDSMSKKKMLDVYQYQKNWWNGRQNNTGKLVSEGLYNFYLEIDGTYTYYGYVYLKY
ncbi:hypothetical protein AQPE_0386 [Aquipluma nitroreducens]|uniref:Uncharacterized protein n=1 Tax=Aquipluma nitroreducens TaxID=2010828 RepID=A0A5K7S424_9BACT|nr:gliding motility-associated C-terminal domain-containing protein [Aquipluma nitroreducens]BBE16249.1 hypothetical protein AQPE_0386 [Aquipluma nitroreducens]